MAIKDGFYAVNKTEHLKNIYAVKTKTKMSLVAKIEESFSALK